MEKESLSKEIYEKLEAYFDSWTDGRHEDDPDDEGVVVDMLFKNLYEEVATAWHNFMLGLGYSEEEIRNDFARKIKRLQKDEPQSP